MFTGLVEEKGRVKRIGGSGNLRLAVEAPLVSRDLKIGDSVSVNGTCLTAVLISAPVVEFDVSRETAERTTTASLKPGDTVNLERPLRAGESFGGHMVLGHVDGIGRIADIRRGPDETVFRFQAPPEIMRLTVEKGSVAADGISLTIAQMGDDWFSAAVIPHTLSATNLGGRSVGDMVNLEADIIGKYVLKFVGKAASSDDSLMAKLSEGGFLE